MALGHDPVDHNADRLTPVEYLRARDARETQFNSLSREIRRTVHDVHRRAEQRVDQPELFEDQAGEAQEPAETMPELSKIDHSNSTISSPEQEIVPSEASEEKTPPEPPRTRRPDPRSRPALPPTPGPTTGGNPRIHPPTHPPTRPGAPHLRRSRRLTNLRPPPSPSGPLSLWERARVRVPPVPLSPRSAGGDAEGRGGHAPIPHAALPFRFPLPLAPSPRGRGLG